MDQPALIDLKVDELVELLQQNPPGQEQARAIRQKISAALNDTASFPEKIEAFRELDADADRLELLDDLELLLAHHQLDSRSASKYMYAERIRKITVIAIGLIMMVLGIGMIVMPASPDFEIYTIYYFSPTDGITVMDVISLLIILTGVYLLISTILKKSKSLIE